MTKVTFVEPDGTIHAVDVKDGQSAMEVAIRHEVPGVPADCGGACSCATCHIYVDEAWMIHTGVAGEIEDAMLELAEDRRPNSRLSCQIQIEAQLDGLILHIPNCEG